MRRCYVCCNPVACPFSVSGVIVETAKKPLRYRLTMQHDDTRPVDIASMLLKTIWGTFHSPIQKVLKRAEMESAD